MSRSQWSCPGMRGGEPSLWCSRLESGPRGRLRLFCFPHGGATSYVYAAWAEHLPADIELWGVHPPGRGTRFGETAIDRVVPLVASLADNLPLSGDLPCVFF